jgi:hypothetical protein
VSCPGTRGVISEQNNGCGWTKIGCVKYTNSGVTRNHD